MYFEARHWTPSSKRILLLPEFNILDAKSRTGWIRELYEQSLDLREAIGPMVFLMRTHSYMSNPFQADCNINSNVDLCILSPVQVPH